MSKSRAFVAALATGMTPASRATVLGGNAVLDAARNGDGVSISVVRDTAKYLGMAEATAKAAGVPFRALHVVHDHPYAAIIEAAEKNHCDLIVMASHGRKGVSALILGSETTKVLTHSKVPVLVSVEPRRVFGPSP